jgi:hypothetical protein
VEIDRRQVGKTMKLINAVQYSIDVLLRRKITKMYVAQILAQTGNVERRSCEPCLMGLRVQNPGVLQSFFLLHKSKA